MFQIKVVDLNEIYISCHVPFLLLSSVFEKISYSFSFVYSGGLYWTSTHQS